MYEEEKNDGRRYGKNREKTKESNSRREKSHVDARKTRND
jgi:hypothetical protein